MNTFIKALKERPSLLLFTVIICFASCSSEEAILTTPGEVVERIDMVLENTSNKEYIYLENEQANASKDLVNYNFFNDSAEKMSFNLKLDDSRILTFTLHNSLQSNFWELENTQYSLHPNQDLNSIYKYVTAQIASNNEVSYTSNLNSTFPNEVETDVFRIIKYDPINYEILIHIENFPVVRESISGLNTLLINGTFRGSITF